jgi:hypothetical protein
VPPDATTLTGAPTSTPSPRLSTTLIVSTTTSVVQSEMPSDEWSSIAGPVAGGVVGGVVVGVLVGALLVWFWRRGEMGRTYPAEQNGSVNYPRVDIEHSPSWKRPDPVSMNLGEEY